jgi:phosphate transport system substrate-binding protein
MAARIMAFVMFISYGSLLALFVLGPTVPVAVTLPGLAHEATPSHTGTAVVPSQLSGWVVADGSSTVWPITADIAEHFAELAPGVEFTVDVSGTSGGFREFCGNQTDVQQASRPITAAEQGACAAAGVTYERFSLGIDGITILVHPNNPLECLTIEQLRALWAPGSTMFTWGDIDPAWPPEPIALYGPDPDSGTFDIFTETIVGESGAIRTDYTPSADDHVLVEGVAADEDALGFAGYAYFAATRDRLKAIAVDAGNGCVAPSRATIGDGSYAPLTRPLYLYVNRASLVRPEMQAFMRHYLASAKASVAGVGYAVLDDDVYHANLTALEAAIAEVTSNDAGTARKSKYKGANDDRVRL